MGARLLLGDAPAAPCNPTRQWPGCRLAFVACSRVYVNPLTVASAVLCVVLCRDDLRVGERRLDLEILVMVPVRTYSLV